MRPTQSFSFLDKSTGPYLLLVAIDLCMFASNLLKQCHNSERKAYKPHSSKDTLQKLIKADMNP